MEEKHFKILEFLSKQNNPVFYKDFPLEIQDMFHYRDTPSKNGSLFIELEVILKNSKKMD